MHATTGLIPQPPFATSSSGFRPTGGDEASLRELLPENWAAAQKPCVGSGTPQPAVA